MNTKSTISQLSIRISFTIIMAIASIASISCHQSHHAFIPLIPSQAICSKKGSRSIPSSEKACYTRKQRDTIHLYATHAHINKENKHSSLLVPSQAITKAHVIGQPRRKSSRLMASTQGKEETPTLTSPSSESQETKSKTNQKVETPQEKQPPRKKHNFKYYGNIPDVHWRAIPIEHLRSHPLYTPLPHPDTIKTLNSLEEVRMFRQDSWQWDELHRGRCTTSQAAPALGLLEPNAAKALGIPRSLQKGCMGAFRRLGQPALRTLEEMNEVLCTGGNGGDKNPGKVWKEMNNIEGGKFPFAAKYMPTLTKEELGVRRSEAKHYVNNLSSPMRVRMSWGNAQEATSVLTAMNHLSKHDPELNILEVGMCGAGLDLNATDSSTGDSPRLIVGASPDSVIRYSNGTLEVLEVKNHCPFVPSDWMSGSKAQKKQKKKFGDYRIRELPLQFSVPAVYIPQLMMEMLSCGKNCRSAIMVRQTATCGAVILRMHRDDEWIEEMIYWLQRFMAKYVDEESPPPPNFFWDGDDESDRYRRFIQRTKELSEQVELVEDVKNGDIQRVLGARGLKLPLFLD